MAKLELTQAEATYLHESMKKEAKLLRSVGKSPSVTLRCLLIKLHDAKVHPNAK